MQAKLLKDCTNLHPKLTENSVHEIYLETNNHYIILIDKLFCGVCKEHMEGV